MKEKVTELLNNVANKCSKETCSKCKYEDVDECLSRWFVDELLNKYDVVEKGAKIRHQRLEIIVHIDCITDFVKQNYNLFNRDYLITVEPVDTQYIRYTFTNRFNN